MVDARMLDSDPDALRVKEISTPGSRFRDRTDAGQRLAARLTEQPLTDPLVLALPRGGVPVGYEVAAALAAPLEVFVVRKVGAPGHPERGIGAIAEGGATAVDSRALEVLGLSDVDFAALADLEREELERRVSAYRGGRPVPAVVDRDVIVVDDGLATGLSAEAALRSLRALHPRRLLLAVPACARQTADRLAALADAVVYVIAPKHFSAVSQWYDDFTQTSDREVVDLLEKSRSQQGRALPMTNLERLTAWIDGYMRAWNSNDPDDIGALFTDDAAYYTAPFREPWRGRAGVVAGWLDRKDEPGETSFTWRPLVVTDDVSIIEGTTTYPDETFSNLWVIRFGEDGRCREFTEWWMEQTKTELSEESG